MAQSEKTRARLKRKARIRRKVFGMNERPRLAVFRSAQHIYAQVVDDVAGKTLAAAGSRDKEIRESAVPEGKKLRKTDIAKLVGQLLADRCKAKGIEKLVFDRSGFRFHGRLAALAEGARQGGMKL